MECLLSITSVVDTDAQGRKLWGKIVHVTAEAELDQHYSEFGFTTSIDGKLIDASLEQILHFKFDPGVQVIFGGRNYTFAHLEKDGTFRLRLNQSIEARRRAQTSRIELIVGELLGANRYEITFLIPQDDEIALRIDGLDGGALAWANCATSISELEAMSDKKLENWLRMRLSRHLGG